ncbi:hypothetical protein KM540_gp012 [Western grey kangaroopox virus]|uniref:Uncharacterized protein n=1 Tax=Western grey kangaroopox virus TaxID=1566307 RepID=A0A2C9DSG0_9POXV|nr:hypothetical protein KM540_gp012 [Western grey kangaroopox virus]ATI20943.1 hypothetical protein [Western grey kangaroopox virus]
MPVARAPAATVPALALAAALLAVPTCGAGTGEEHCRDPRLRYATFGTRVLLETGLFPYQEPWPEHSSDANTAVLFFRGVNETRRGGRIIAYFSSGGHEVMVSQLAEKMNISVSAKHLQIPRVSKLHEGLYFLRRSGEAEPSWSSCIRLVVGSAAVPVLTAMPLRQSMLSGSRHRRPSLHVLVKSVRRHRSKCKVSASCYLNRQAGSRFIVGWLSPSCGGRSEETPALDNSSSDLEIEAVVPWPSDACSFRYHCYVVDYEESTIESLVLNVGDVCEISEAPLGIRWLFLVPFLVVFLLVFTATSLFACACRYLRRCLLQLYLCRSGL